MRKDREARAKKARGGMCARSGGLKRLNLSVASDEGGKKGPVGPAAQRRQIEGFFGVEEAPKKTVRELALEKGVSDKRMNRRLKEVTTHSKCSSQGIALSAVGGGEARPAIQRGTAASPGNSFSFGAALPCSPPEAGVFVGVRVDNGSRDTGGEL